MSFVRTALLTICFSASSLGEASKVIGEEMDERYKRAFSFQSLYSKVYNKNVNFHRIDNSYFWYCLVGPNNYFHYYLCTINNSKSGADVKDAFDHKLFTKVLSEFAGEQLIPFHVNISKLKFLNDGFEFDYKNQRYLFSQTENRISKLPNNASETNASDKKSINSQVGHVFRKNYNLYLKKVSGDVIQLTNDGDKNSPYGISLVSPISNEQYSIANGNDSGWTDSSGNYQISWKMSVKDAPKYSYIKSTPNGSRPKVLNGCYCFAGDEKLPQSELYFIDKKRHLVKKLDIPPQVQLFNGCPSFQTFDDHNNRFLIFQYERGFRKFTLFEVSVDDGVARKLFSEEHEKGVNIFHFYWQPVNKGRELLMLSERDGWRHLYRFDLITGKVMNQITKGDWIVRKIAKIDEEKQNILFYASGVTEGVNPYISQLCRVNFDGTGFKVLTPEPYNHQCGFVDDYIVDTYSSTDLPYTSVLRRLSDGKVLTKLADADVSELNKLNIPKPETFSAKGEDKVTDIFGVVWRPSGFDTTQKYPVIDFIYSGPHTDLADFSFNSFCWENQMLAELGFVVVVINGKGTEGRGRAFRDVCYKNLGRAGLPDHIAWLKALGKKYPYLDLNRVGIYGHSAGGYDSARAMLEYSDFYKVCVSSAGVHDFRLDKASWVEQWMGYPAGEWYDKQSNVNNAHKLKGHLLLMHGELDDNVPVTSTLRFAEALQKAGKSFDMMIFPNQQHGLYGKTFIKKRMDFLVRYLHGVEPSLDVK